MTPARPFTAAHEALRTEVRAYVEAELRPHAPAWEAARWFPREVFGGLAERGWLGLKYGEGADWVRLLRDRRADTARGRPRGPLLPRHRARRRGARERAGELGWHASDTAEIAFDDVAVPDENLLDEEGRGFYLIVANFQWERLLMALGAVGSMRCSLERTVALLRDRPVSQSVRHRVAELAVSLEVGTALTYQALRRFLDGGDAVRDVTMAKLLTQRANFELQDACFQVFADVGHPDAEDLARAARDACLGPIGGGTDEIMKEILGKTLGL